MKNLSIALLSLILLMGACKSKKQVSSTSTVEDREEIASEPEQKEIFSLSSSPCFGPCKVFDLYLYENGTLKVNAKENLPFDGSKTKQLNEQELAQFKALLNQIEWQNLERRYESTATDLQSFNFSYQNKGEKYEVYLYGFEPKKLQSLFEEILELYVMKM